jgi:hypothetical protein
MFDAITHIAEIADALTKRRDHNVVFLKDVKRQLQEIANGYMNSELADIFSEDEDAVAISNGDFEIENLTKESDKYVFKFYGHDTDSYEITVSNAYWYSTKCCPEERDWRYEGMGSVNKRIFTDWIKNKVSINTPAIGLSYFNHKELALFIEGDEEEPGGNFEDFKRLNNEVYIDYIAQCDFITAISCELNRELTEREVQFLMDAYQKIKELNSSDLIGYGEFVRNYSYVLKVDVMKAVLACWKKMQQNK